MMLMNEGLLLDCHFLRDRELEKEMVVEEKTRKDMFNRVEKFLSQNH